MESTTYDDVRTAFKPNYRIFEEFAFFIIAEVRRRKIQKIFELDGHVYAFNSTAFDLCLPVFEWAKLRKHRGGIKMHTLYDVEDQSNFKNVNVLCDSNEPNLFNFNPVHF